MYTLNETQCFIMLHSTQRATKTLQCSTQAKRYSVAHRQNATSSDGKMLWKGSVDKRFTNKWTTSSSENCATTSTISNTRRQNSELLQLSGEFDLATFYSSWICLKCTLLYIIICPSWQKQNKNVPFFSFFLFSFFLLKGNRKNNAYATKPSQKIII